MKTAAILIIGNEILSGRIRDTNSAYLASELRELGVDVRRIAVIPDDVDVIASEVPSMSALYDYVFTSGGIGPTHDDMTMQGIAKGFALDTVTNDNIAALIRARCGSGPSSVSMKMAELPRGAEVIDVEDMNFPPVVLRNVYIFPGIPELLREKFSAIRERFRSDPFIIEKIFVNADECLIADHLDNVDSEFPDVMVGSYPYVDIPDYKVVVTLECRDHDRLSEAFDMLIGLLPAGSVVKPR
jgi:molybdenum cofactor synthesis domain-containing protein